MTGHGISHGAVSVMNAIPCGIGSTIGIDLRTRARFEPSERTSIELAGRPELDTNLVETCVRRTLEWIGAETYDYHLEVETDIPPSMGLKSSSSVCNSVIRSVLDHHGINKDDLEIVRLGVSCAKECKVTITGAFDDACGCELGGLVITDNSKNELLNRIAIPSYDVVICIPDRNIPKSKVPVDRYRELSSQYESMVPRIADDYLNVLTENGRFVEDIIGGDHSLAEKAMESGALAAGISGTGPALAILTEKGRGKEISDSMGCRTIITETR